MSESSGNSALGLHVTTSQELELKLTFESKTYSLHSFTSRLQDVEALMSVVLNVQPKRAGAQGSGMAHIQVVDGIVVGGHHDPLKNIKVKSVKLNSPLEVVLGVSATVPGILLVLPKILNGLIGVKNNIHKSSQIGAVAKNQKKRLELENEVVDFLRGGVSKLKLNDYNKLPQNHPNKQLIKAAVRALDQLKDVDIKEK